MMYMRCRTLSRGPYIIITKNTNGYDFLQLDTLSLRFSKYSIDDSNGVGRSCTLISIRRDSVIHYSHGRLWRITARRHLTVLGTLPRTRAVNTISILDRSS